jgi:hypothetical protein
MTSRALTALFAAIAATVLFCVGGIAAVGSAVPCTSGDACASATAVLARAATWLTAWNGGPVPYLSSSDPATWLGGYRRDCSGFISMARGLPGPGLDTAGLAARSAPLRADQLRAGDLLIRHREARSHRCEGYGPIARSS